MSRPQLRIARFSAALAALLALCAIPASALQLAKTQKQAAASGAQSSGGNVPLRVGLVISEAVHTYRTSYMLSHIDFGKHLATQTNLVFGQTFAAVQQMLALPADPSGAAGLDLLIVLEAPEGTTHQSGLVSGTVTLSVRFTVCDARGAQLFQLQETVSEKGSNVNNMLDRLGEAIARKFIQDFLVSPNVRALLSPAPAAPVETKPVLADTAAMDSSGLDVPPPPPWGRGAAPNPAGKP